MKAKKIILILSLMVVATISQTFAQESTVEVETREALRARAQDLRTPTYVVSPMQRQSSELSFSKRFDNESIESEKSFIINKNSENISLSLSGNAMEGNIKLTLLSPDGKEYQVLEIDNSSDLRWRQTFALDEETEKLIGKWKIKIKAENATGNYMFRMVSQ